MSLTPGARLKGKEILEVRELGGGRFLVKTRDSKSDRDFLVRYVWATKPRVRFYTPKHAHFAIDFYGKVCADKARARKVLEAVVAVWHRQGWQEVVSRFADAVQGLPGYDLAYVVGALDWIYDQEDLNFDGRPPQKQTELNALFKQCRIAVPTGRQGSPLAVSLLCRVWLGTHPVEALLSTNIRNR